MHHTKKQSKKSFVIFVITVILSITSTVSANAATDKKYIPGGMPFGAKIYCDGLIISMFTDPSDLGCEKNPSVNGGLKCGDVIKCINGRTIRQPSALADIIDSSNGEPLNISVVRDGKEETFKVKPVKCPDGKYRIGINVRDTMAGIGTVTFISCDSGAFGGLGHGICDPYTSDVIPIQRGSTNEVKINNIVKGTDGKPGEIRGSFMSGRTGTLLKNTECGVFGIFSSVPSGKTPLSTADLTEVKTGNATILCTLDNEGVKSYTIEIESIDKDASSNTKNFHIKITDKELLEKTGGIIQGMSGSPIIQNGMLVGAVTHVMVNDPQRGYGIYIGNMLKEVPALLT